VPTPHLDGKHTVFGEVTTGLDVVNKIQKRDKIIELTIVDDVKPLFKAQQKRIAEWNEALEKAGHIPEPTPDA
jgi:peptidyl-prolyl cis-trans isomerase B (cyclophilin B)